jgi:hypothetical protein
MNDSSEHDADDEGRFAIEDVERGRVELRAHVDGFAPSAALELEVRPAEPQEELELALRVGGTLTGEVYRKDGTPDPNQQVMAQQPMGGDGNARRRPTARGASRWSTSRRPLPGDLRAGHGERHGARRRGSGGDDRALRMGAVEVRRRGDGARRARRAARGARAVDWRRARGGRPMPELFVMALVEGSSMLSNLKSARTAADGTFSIQLPSAGDWILLVGEWPQRRGQRVLDRGARGGDRMRWSSTCRPGA